MYPARVRNEPCPSSAGGQWVTPGCWAARACGGSSWPCVVLAVVQVRRSTLSGACSVLRCKWMVSRGDPHLNSPNASVISMLLTPWPRIASRALLPVVMWTTSLRFCSISAPVMNPKPCARTHTFESRLPDSSTYTCAHHVERAEQMCGISYDSALV
eukprot:1177079-Prorocentrum_minimum.AAC.8